METKRLLLRVISVQDISEIAYLPQGGLSESVRSWEPVEIPSKRYTMEADNRIKYQMTVPLSDNELINELGSIGDYIEAEVRTNSSLRERLFGTHKVLEYLSNNSVKLYVKSLKKPMLA